MGIFRNLVFVNQLGDSDFDQWISPLRGGEWPHDLSSGDVREATPLVYDLKCNWKVFVENAIDGYHLAYLHEHTLGGPTPDQNLWEKAGQHMIWYANEDGIRHRLPAKIRENGQTGMIASASDPGYGGVYYLFPRHPDRCDTLRLFHFNAASDIAVTDAPNRAPLGWTLAKYG